MAAPVLVAASALGNSTAGTFTVTLPAHVADDVFLSISWYRASATVPTPTDWTQAATWLRGTTRYYLHWRRAAGAAETNPVFDYTGTDDGFGLVCVYRGCIATGNPYDVLGATATGTANPATLTGITTLTDDSLVVALIGGEDNTGTGATMAATDPAAFVEHYAESATGTDGCCAIGEASRATAGATGSVSCNFGATVVGWGGVVLALIPATGVTHTVSVVFSGAGTISAAAALVLAAGAGFSGAGSFTATAKQIHVSSIAVAAVASTGFTAGLIKVAQAVYAGVASFAAAGSRAINAATTFAGQALLSAQGGIAKTASVAYTNVAAFITGGSVVRNASVTFQGTATFNASCRAVLVIIVAVGGARKRIRSLTEAAIKYE